MNKINNANFTILMVDDIPRNLQVLGSILKAQNYNVEFALNGTNALQWLTKRDFDLVLLDVMMPDMDGFQVCETIRKEAKYNDMPIIFLTAKDDQHSVIEGFRLGAQDYIKKPFDARELLSRVNTHIELKHRKEEVTKMNDWLEERVKERTAKLNSALTELEEANKELLVLDKAKSDFINIISHQLRTPLNSIKLPIEIMKNKVDTKELIEMVDILDSSVEQLEKFSGLALDFTYLKSGKRKLYIQEVVISELVEFAIMRCTKSITHKMLKIDYDYDELDFVLNADYELLLDCMSNIIMNTIYFSPESETIIVKATEKENQLEVSLTNKLPDNCTIDVDRLLDTFTSGEDNIELNNGMGLAYAKLIIEHHKGSLNIVKSSSKKLLTKLIFPK